VIATVADYRNVTGEAFPPDPTVLVNLQRAQSRVEDLTERLLDTAVRTESVEVRDGKAYPKAYPVTAVTTPATSVPSPDGKYIVTNTTNWQDQISQMLGASDVLADPVFVLFTYTGGYAAGQAPVGLVEAICELAQRYGQPANTAAVPAGVNSVGLGNQSYSGGTLGGSSKIPPALKADIRRYRHIVSRMAD
jgi:hypothetical protein